MYINKKKSFIPANFRLIFWTTFVMLIMFTRISAFEWDKLTDILKESNFNGSFPHPGDPKAMDMFLKIQEVLKQDPALWNWMKTKAQELQAKNMTPFDAGMDLWRDYKTFMKEQQQKVSTPVSTNQATIKARDYYASKGPGPNIYYMNNQPYTVAGSNGHQTNNQSNLYNQNNVSNEYHNPQTFSPGGYQAEPVAGNGNTNQEGFAQGHPGYEFEGYKNERTDNQNNNHPEHNNDPNGAHNHGPSGYYYDNLKNIKNFGSNKDYIKELHSDNKNKVNSEYDNHQHVHNTENQKNIQENENTSNMNSNASQKPFISRVWNFFSNMFT